MGDAASQAKAKSRPLLAKDESRLDRHAVSSRASIQRRRFVLARIVILSVYGADTIAEVKLLISPFLR